MSKTAVIIFFTIVMMEFFFNKLVFGNNKQGNKHFDSSH